MRIAVVIPALDEAEQIGAAIASAREASGADGLGADAGARGRAEAAVSRRSGATVEILVVDGGSRDRTADRARAAGARVIPSSPGRALQLERGWRASEGDVVLFLHADTRLPEAWASRVCEALRDPGVVGGAFTLRFRERSPGLRVVEWGARLRAGWAGLPYGDQALFARRSVLEAMGGVPCVPIAEDLDLVQALRRRGRLALLRDEVTTSGRRYLEHGVLRTTLRHALALVGWRLGVDRARLARWAGR